VGYTPTLVDGGVYDNLGVEPIKFCDRQTCLVVANSGGILRMGSMKRLPIASSLARSNSVMYRQTSSLRMRDLVDRFKQWERARDSPGGKPAPSTALRGVVFGLGTTMDTVSPNWLAGRPRDRDPNLIEGLPTSFSKFSSDSASRLIQRGWWLTGASLATFHPELVSNLPVIAPIPRF
jgi:NTE family protein